MVRKRGFEPPRGCPRQPLKLVRLPFRDFRLRTSVQPEMADSDCRVQSATSAAAAHPSVLRALSSAPQPESLLPASLLPASLLPPDSWSPEPSAR